MVVFVRFSAIVSRLSSAMYFATTRFTDALRFEIVSHAGSVLFEAGPTKGQVLIKVFVFCRR